jgi:Asp-tRNA(Asn)/Glu-tRNA(Gln) amidotransferase A subunit family amidase
MQLIGKPLDEAALIRIAAAYEAAAGHAGARPPEVTP